MTPYTLLITRENGSSQRIDPDEWRWHEAYAEWMRGRSRWYLVHRESDAVLLTLEVADGDRPYYEARHMRQVQGPRAGILLTAYGIGAKRECGRVDRLWIMPNGKVSADDDPLPAMDRMLREPTQVIGGKE